MKIRIISVLLLVALINPVSLNGSKPDEMTAQQVISAILKKTGCREIPNTVDVIKAGKPDTKVTGIVSCMFATMDVLKQAVAKKCNLIIVHEPLFYNHLDQTSSLGDDQVYKDKLKYINDHSLVIWRFHDYIHSMNPDGIEVGMTRKLGWEKYLVKGTTNEYKLRELSLGDLLKNLKVIFPKNTFNVVGKTDMKVTSVVLAEGAPRSSTHIRILERPDIDVVIAGESQQWETYEYMRDAVDQGKNKAIIFLGHIPSEEGGMEYCAEWLKTFITGIPVYFITCGPSYWSF